MLLSNPAAEYGLDSVEGEEADGVGMPVRDCPSRVGKAAGALASGTLASKEVVCLAWGSSKPRLEYADMVREGLVRALASTPS